MAQRDDIREIARGRWRHILTAAGVHESHLSGKHVSCPTCGGEDRFRWDNRAGSGSSICNVCGSRTGMDLVMAIKGVGFLDAKRWVLSQISNAPIEAPRASRDNEAIQRRLSRLWMEANRLDGRDPASRYLASRAIRPREYPTLLRYHASAAYRHDDQSVTRHPALVSKFVSPDAKAWTLHMTYLDSDGNKANVPKVKKLAPMSVPRGGAVRLAPSAETMGIAEGVETALSAMAMHDVPVWAALSSGGLVNWQPPETAKCVLIYGDHDSNYAGAAAAYALAHKLAAKGLHVEVRMPSDPDSDWNDMLMAEKG